MKCSIYLLQSANYKRLFSHKVNKLSPTFRREFSFSELKQEFYTAGNQRQTVDIITDNMDVD